MTREEKLYAMRTRDLVQYCLDHGIKVSQTKGNLKEARAGVIQRILAAEKDGVMTVDSLLTEFKSMSDDMSLAAWYEKVNQLDHDDQIRLFDALGSIKE